MIDRSWRVEYDEPQDGQVNVPSTGFVSLHFLRSALRRRWKVWVGITLAGLMLGAAYNVVVPAKAHGTVTLLLEHDPNTDPVVAMDTDMSLLRTRTVAESVIRELGLPMTTETFQETVAATDLTPTVLVIDVVAPDDSSAQARVSALADTFLAFRGTQLEAQSDALVDGYEQQIADMKTQASHLTDQYNALVDAGPEHQTEATDVLTRRSLVGAEISRLQQLVEDTSLQSHAIVVASHVLDPPSVVPQSRLRRLVLTIGSGLIGGLALGIGVVLFQALTSSLLRRREEVALALAAPVRFTAGSRRHLRRRRRSPSRELQVLVRGLESAVVTHQRRQARVGLLAVDEPDEAALVIGTLGARLAASGKSVFMVDLTRSGPLERVVARARKRESDTAGVEPVVFRPEREPTLARGPLGGAPAAWTELPKDHPRRPAWDAADVVLVLAEVDPSLDVDHLRSWIDQVVLLVTAGRSSAERLRTVGELVRSAGLQLLFAMMVGSDATDESSGVLEPAEGEWAGARPTTGTDAGGAGR